MAEVLLEDAPRKARDLYDKGFAAMERGNLDYAMDMFMAALSIEPRLLRVRKFLRAAQIKSRGKGNSFTHGLATAKGIGTLLSAKSKLGKKPLEAVTAAEQLLRTDPLNMTFIQLLATAAVAAELPEVAVQALELAWEHNPGNADLVDQLGRCYLDVGETQKARDCFEKLVVLRPKDQKALKALKDSAALDTMKSGGWNAAGSYRDVMKDQKEATLLEQQGRSVKAGSGVEALIEDTLEKIQKDPDNVNYRRSLADLYARANRFDEALEVLEEALAKAGGSDPDVDRAMARIRTKVYDHQLAEFRKNGQDAEAAALEAERDSFVFANAEERVKKYPTELQFKYDLGVLQLARGEINDAIKLFQAAQKHPQVRTRALFYMGQCFFQKKQYDIAAEQYEKAVGDLTQMDDTKKDILYELGRAYEAMNQPEQAKAYYKEIYSADIGYKDVAHKIENGDGGN
jgi:tetratricopeptide (TPR) repeat protein